MAVQSSIHVHPTVAIRHDFYQRDENLSLRFGTVTLSVDEEKPAFCSSNVVMFFHDIAQIDRLTAELSKLRNELVVADSPAAADVCEAGSPS